MNDDALAAVVAAAQLLYGRAKTEDSASAAACWTIAGRLRTLDAERIRRVARFAPAGP